MRKLQISKYNGSKAPNSNIQAFRLRSRYGATRSKSKNTISDIRCRIAEAGEKRAVAAVWERHINGRCLFVMPEGKDLEMIRQKIKR